MKKIFIIISFISLFQGFCFAQWNTDRILTIGRNALYFEDYVLSIQYFNQVIAVKPYLAEPYMYRAMAKIQLGDYQGADKDCTEAISRNPFIPQAYYTRGFARAKLNFFQEAVDDFTKAFEFSPNSWFLLLNRMDAKAQQKDYKGALDDLGVYMEQNPKMTELYYEKGRLQLALNDTVGAVNALNEFVKEDPGNSLAWSARGLLFLQLDRLDEALNDYNKAIELKTTHYGDYINRGIINVRKNNFMQALNDYDVAIKMEKNNPLAYYNRGLLRANLGDTNNALDDIEKVLELDPASMEARLQKAMLEMTLGNYEGAVDDYKLILEKHKDFLPAYLAIAQAEKQMGNDNEAARYYQKGVDLEEKMKNRKKDETLVADNKIDDQPQQGASKSRTDMFNRFAAQNMEKAEKESKYVSDIRGTVQDKYTEIENETNFVLSYYAKSEEFRQTNYYHTLIKLHNNKNKGNSPIKITNQEVALAEKMIAPHFTRINELSALLDENSKDADVFFSRAIEFATVQDFSSAIQDLNEAIALRPDFALAYFERANVRYKQIEYANVMSDDELFTGEKDEQLKEKQYALEAEMVMRDYDKVISLVPDFSFTYFNKGNVLASLKDFRGAISSYSKAIGVDGSFAEAYYNRGLIYLFIGEDDKGLADLSKAGELGIYKAYNLIKRFNQ